MTDDDNGPDPHAGSGTGQNPIAWFKGLLRAHVREQGGGSYRELETAATAVGLPLARATIGNALSGPHVPRQDTVSRLVTVLHLRRGLPGEPDRRTWERHHEHLDDLLAAARTGARTAADARIAVEGRTWPRRFGKVPEAPAAFLPRRPAHVPPGPGRFLLTGDGGVGKTHTAAAYVRAGLHQGDLDLVIWVSGTTRETLVSGLAAAAGDLTGTSGQDAEAAAARLERWLAKVRRTWCVVIDGLDTPKNLDGLWPPDTPAGVTLITTRRRDAALQDRGTVIDLAPFTPEESLAYLTERLGTRAGPPADLAALADDFGHLPLALSQAAAFLLDNGLTVARYRRRLARKGNLLGRLVPEAGSVPDEYSLPLSAAWSLSVEQADALRPAGVAGPVMHVLSLLDGSGVPGELFATPALAALVPHADAESAHEDVHDALHNLRRLSLVALDGAPHHLPHPAAHPGSDPDPGAADPQAGTSVRIHTLTQRATRDLLRPHERHTAVTAAAAALTEGWQRPALPPGLDRALRANALALVDHARDELLTPAPHPVLYRTGHSLGDSGQAAAALRHFRRLREAVEARFPPDDEISLDTRGHLAWWQAKAGDPAGAARSFAALHTDQARLYPPEHPNLLQTRQSAAVWRGAAGDPHGAVAELRALYALRTALQGAGHRDTISNRNHLANFLAASGDHEGALELHEQAWREDEARLGPGHRDVLRSRAAAMRHRGELGDVAGALAALRDLLEVQQEDDPDGPETFATRGGIADWTGRGGDPAAAVALLEPLLADRLRVMGPEHPHTLSTRTDLARWRTAAGDGARAAAELTDLVADQLEFLGPAHPALAVTRAALAAARAGTSAPDA
ncbi:tetratricopeptide repeat protein [Streptomyces sp. NPDC093224]|uniref:tetratricopeptide repeat protein n=1 Tax=Streptomyces sp. NPDC093224 TaxID=3155198 RepID=UPI00343EBC3F